jgi:DNA repair photolyase
MPVIYEPKGAAAEYGELAANLFTGCPHRCTYCYVPDVLRKDRAEFHSNVKPRDNVLVKLEADAEKLERKGDKRPVFLCFTCDPYPPDERNWEITRDAIKILHTHGLNFTVLTKSGALAQRDFDLYQSGDTFGVTLTFSTISHSKLYEPGAPLAVSRLDNLREAHKRIRTFASCEPVIYPEQTLKLIEVSAPYVDIFKIGKLNHIEPPEPIDWRKFAHDAMDLLTGLRKSYVIKKDLAKYLTEV